LGLLTFWAMAGSYGAPWTAVISHAIFFVTLPLVTLSLGFSTIDRSLVEAASIMGADSRTVLRTVVLPLILERRSWLLFERQMQPRRLFKMRRSIRGAF
ncbi:MAG: ABC transporter permease subunit, partial [Mesorhizobium sp.]